MSKALAGATERTGSIPAILMDARANAGAIPKTAMSMRSRQCRESGKGHGSALEIALKANLPRREHDAELRGGKVAQRGELWRRSVPRIVTDGADRVVLAA